MVQKRHISKIISYIEYIVQLIEPSQLLYIVIDGVAPRSKMQQRKEDKSAQDRNMKPAMTGCDKRTIRMQYLRELVL